MDPISQATPSYGETYRPFDQVAFYNQQAQAHYESMRAQMQMQQAQLRQDIRANTQAVRMADSFTQSVEHTMFRPGTQEIATHSLSGSGYADDISERFTGFFGDAYSTVGQFALDLGVGLMADEWLVDPFFKRRYNRKHAAALRQATAMGLTGDAAQAAARKSMNGPMYLSKMMRGGMHMGTSLGVGVAASAGASVALDMAGVNDAFSQFDHINDIRGGSEDWMAGVAGDAFTGRVNKDGAKQIYDSFRNEGRLSSLYHEGDSFEDLMRDASIMSEHELIQGVRSADDFLRKFKGLRAAVGKITETLGTTFTEGVETLAKYQNMGVRPEHAMDLVLNTSDTAARHGITFAMADTAGMKSALSLQGSGLTFQAAHGIGVGAAGLSQTISEAVLGGHANHLNERHLYNMGGEEGVRMALERAVVGALQNTNISSALIASFGQGGAFDSREFVQRAVSGDTARNLNDSLSRVRGPEDILRIRAETSKRQSEILEQQGGPEIIMAAQIAHTYQAAERLGMSDLSVDQISQLAPELAGVDSTTFKAMIEAVSQASVGLGRQKEMRAAQGETRMRALMGGGVFDDVGYALRNSGAIQDIYRSAAYLTDMVGGDIHNFSRDLSRRWDRARGVVQIDIDPQLYDMYEEFSGESNILDEAQIYREGTLSFNRDQASMVTKALTRGLLSVDQVTQQGNISINGNLEVSQENLRKLGEMKGLTPQQMLDRFATSQGEQLREGNLIRNMHNLSIEKLREGGFTTVEDTGWFNDKVRIVDHDQLREEVDRVNKNGAEYASALDDFEDVDKTAKDVPILKAAYDDAFRRMAKAGGGSIDGLISMEGTRGATAASAITEAVAAQGLEGDEARRMVKLLTDRFIETGNSQMAEVVAEGKLGISLGGSLAYGQDAQTRAYEMTRDLVQDRYSGFSFRNNDIAKGMMSIISDEAGTRELAHFLSLRHAEDSGTITEEQILKLDELRVSLQDMSNDRIPNIDQAVDSLFDEERGGFLGRLTSVKDTSITPEQRLQEIRKNMMIAESIGTEGGEIGGEGGTRRSAKGGTMDIQNDVVAQLNENLRLLERVASLVEGAESANVNGRNKTQESWLGGVWGANRF